MNRTEMFNGNVFVLRNRCVFGVFIRSTNRKFQPKPEVLKSERLRGAFTLTPMSHPPEANAENGADSVRPISDSVTSVGQLEYAACQFDVRRVDDVIDDVTDVNDVNDEGRSALHEMLEKYASLDRSERSKVKGGLLAVMSRLSARGADVSEPIRNRKGPTSSNYRFAPLHIIAKCDDSRDVIEALIASGAEVDMVEGHGRSALHLAVEGALLGSVRALLDGGGDVTKRDEYGQTALHYAVKGRQRPTELIQTLIEHGADINAKDISNRTPVHVAAKYSNVKVMRLLLAHGGHVNKMDDSGLTPVHYAALHDSSGYVLRELLKYTSDINKQSAVTMETPLHAAVRHRMTENVITLCETGNADVNIGDIFGDTPLHKAVKLEDWQLWLALLRSGGDPYKQNSQGVTPMSLLKRECNQLRALIAKYRTHGTDEV